MRIKKGDVRESLIEQLKEKGADVACFSDLIEDYMKLWSIKNKLGDGHQQARSRI